MAMVRPRRRDHGTGREGPRRALLRPHAATGGPWAVLLFSAPPPACGGLRLDRSLSRRFVAERRRDPLVRSCAVWVRPTGRRFQARVGPALSREEACLGWARPGQAGSDNPAALPPPVQDKPYPMVPVLEMLLFLVLP
uniref:Uncharacterized protein n=1 Tax=Oryza sativa subsp. japonica TaxID=39947 RepID=Q6ZBQ5_ORYSJ|nr:hypothetical protein [Oryza sativa Japonica Group]